MKELMLGNKALARGLYEAGCSVVSSYPGTPSTEVTEEAAKFEEIYCEWAPNEKVAMEVAFGASLAGKRSFCGMKHVGMNVAADPMFTASYTGVNAGLVICVADDPGMHSSQNEQDSRHYAEAAKLPMLEPSDSEEAYEFAKLAYEISEQFDTPVIIKMCTRVAHSQSVVETGERVLPQQKPYLKNIAKYVMMPGNAIRRHPAVEERMRSLAAYAEKQTGEIPACQSGECAQGTSAAADAACGEVPACRSGEHTQSSAAYTEVCPLNRVEMGDTSLGIITSSTCYQYVKEIFGNKVSVLKLGMVYPLPEQAIRDFASKVERLIVVEEMDPFIENQCRAMGLAVTGKDVFPREGEFSQNLIAEKLGLPVPAHENLKEALPARPPAMCSGCPHRGLFYTLAKNKCTVLGDIGCYTLGAVAPFAAMDMTLCMGASVSALHGFNKALGKESEGKTVAVIGDSTFMHSGMTGLANIAYNQSNSTVIILDNSITGMTGHQQNPTTGYNIKGEPAGKIDLESLCRAMGIERVRVVDPYDLAVCDRVLKEELTAEEPSVIISRRPCVLLKYVKTNPPIKVDEKKCIGCKSCMRLGCPALTVKNKKAVIDTTLCVGCGVCAQLCRFGALGGA